MKLNFYERSDGIRSMTKIKQDNNVTNHTGTVYIEK